MKKVLMAASVLLLATAAIPAAAQGFSLSFGSGYGGYGNGYSSYGGYGNGYGGYGGYGRGNYYNPYTAYLREYRQHSRLHRQLGEAHGQAHDEGIHGRADHVDTHNGLGEVHDQYHYDRGY